MAQMAASPVSLKWQERKKNRTKKQKQLPHSENFKSLTGGLHGIPSAL